MVRMTAAVPSLCIWPHPHSGDQKESNLHISCLEPG